MKLIRAFQHLDGGLSRRETITEFKLLPLECHMLTFVFICAMFIISDIQNSFVNYVGHDAVQCLVGAHVFLAA